MPGIEILARVVSGAVTSVAAVAVEGVVKSPASENNSFVIDKAEVEE